MKETLRLINEWITSKMYGKITLSFEAGVITIIRKEETIKPKGET